jgi:hypothetical protein
MLDMFDHAKILPEEIYAKVKEMTTPDSEAVFVAHATARARSAGHARARSRQAVYSQCRRRRGRPAAMNVDPKIMNCGSLLRKLSSRTHTSLQSSACARRKRTHKTK